MVTSLGAVHCVVLLLSLVNAGYRVSRTFGPRSGRLWPAVAQEFRWIASLLPLSTCNLASPWSPWVYATDASGVTRRSCDPVDAAAPDSCVERWRFLAEEFNSARRSVLVEHERKVHKASWRVVELKTYTKFVVLTCILLWMETCKIVLTQCLMIALSSKMCHPSYYSPSLLGACFLEVSGGSLWRSYGVRVKPMSWWLRHACRSTENLEKRLLGYCSSWTTWPRSWVLQRAAVVPRVSTTLVARSVSSLLPGSHPCLQMDGV